MTGGAVTGAPSPLAQALIAFLRETAESGHSAAEAVYGDFVLMDDVPAADRAALDAALFECEGCGWWTDLARLTGPETAAASGYGTRVCTDCAPEPPAPADTPEETPCRP